MTDRYTKAIEQLGSEKLDVRIGGIYALERVARDSARDHPTVVEVLAAFIREHSREPWPLLRRRQMQPVRSTRPDVQAAISVLGRRDRKRDSRPLISAGVNLTGATAPPLGGLRPGSNLSGSNLAGADLVGQLSGARTSSARTSPARISLTRTSPARSSGGGGGGGRRRSSPARTSPAARWPGNARSSGGLDTRHRHWPTGEQAGAGPRTSRGELGLRGYGRP